ncbi:MAG: hypothetical protein AB1730_14095 [Myxococcota bacterium]
MASALLLFALVGVVALLSRAANAERDGNVAVTATSLAQQTLAEVAAARYEGLTAGTGLDGGVTYDGAGRRYGRIIDIFDGTADGGFASYDIRVRVEYNSSLPPPFQTVLQTEVWGVVAQSPDGGGP